MTTRGIVCSAHEVRGLPKGAVSLLVRPMKMQPYTLRTEGFGFPTRKGGFVSQRMIVDDCPFGKSGDRRWVREAFVAERGTNRIVGYQADGARSDKKSQYGAASVHMPLWASRLTLQLSEVRVMRVKELMLLSNPNALGHGFLFGGGMRYRTFDSYWKGVHGSESWDRNDWVWLLSVSVVPQDSKESE